METGSKFTPLAHGLPSPSGDIIIDLVCDKLPVHDLFHRTYCQLQVPRKSQTRAQP